MIGKCSGVVRLAVNLHALHPLTSQIGGNLHPIHSLTLQIGHMLQLLKSIPPFLASVVALFSTLFSLIIPWSSLNILFDDSDYQVSVPVKFGILGLPNSNQIDQRYSRFLDVAFTTVLLLISSSLLSLVSIVSSIFCAINFDRIFFNGQNLLVVVGLFFNLMAIGSYIIPTFSYLNGGSYINGIWLNSMIVLMGLSCVLVSLFADAEIKRSLDEDLNVPLHHRKLSVRTNYMSVEES